MDRVSFWRPEHIPENEKEKEICELLSIGKLDEVIEKLGRIPHMRTVPSLDTSSTLFWNCDRGIFLYFKGDSAKNVMYISANSFCSTKILFKFYVQMFEHLELTLLNEDNKEFYSLKAFKKLLKE